MTRPASPAQMTAGLEKPVEANGAIKPRLDAGMRHVDHCTKIQRPLLLKLLTLLKMPMPFPNGDTNSANIYSLSSERKLRMWLPFSDSAVLLFSTHTLPSPQTWAHTLSSH